MWLVIGRLYLVGHSLTLVRHGTEHTDGDFLKQGQNALACGGAFSVRNGLVRVGLRNRRCLGLFIPAFVNVVWGT